MSQGAGKTYEMLWDCQFCGTQKLLGKTHRHCPNCGAPQDPNSRYYPSDDEKVAVEDHVYVGADKICDSCTALNAGNAEFCGNCGAPLTEAARAKTLESQVKADGESFKTSGSRDVTKEKFEAEMTRIGATGKKGGFNWRTMAVIGVVALVIVGAIAALTATRETKIIVRGHSWEREILIEQYQQVREGAWDEQVPIDAYSTSCSQRQRDTRQVPDGQECRTIRTDNGDGTFSEREQCTTRYRSEPVYDTWCDYTIDRWAYGRSVTTSGQSVNESPVWGEVTLKCEGQARLGCERESSRKETYLVHFAGTDNDKTYQCPFPQDQWQNIRVESLWNARVRVIDAGAVDCNSLELAN